MSEEQRESALALFKTVNHGALATIEAESPYAAAVNFIYDDPAGSGSRLGRTYFLLSGLSRHTKNIRKNANVSLLVTEDGEKAIFEKRRASAQGSMAEVKDEARILDLKARYQKAFPQAQLFLTFSDFKFFEMEIREVHYIGGFADTATLR